MPTLDWIGKQAVANHHQEVPYHLLRDVPELGCGPSDSGNLIVEGDNLTALKALLPYYAGQVKCIYIDPPYNTGNEGWVYNDNVNSPEINAWLGKVVGKEAEDLSRHDKWLCMMYPRLKLLREFLREDGAIFVSLDDNEIGNCRQLLDEIFGPQNILANCIWQKKYTRANDAAFFSDNHDHVIAYAKKKKSFSIGRVERTEMQDKAYKNPDNHPLGPWKPTPLHAKSGTDRSEFIFKNGVKWSPPAGTYRRFSDESMRRMDENDEIWFGAKGDAIPQRKTFLGSLSAGLTPVTFWSHEVAGDNHIGKDEVKEIMADTGITFDSPKPTSLINLVLQLATAPGDIVLDSFAGSGSTGHAVLKADAMNGSKMAKRRFILVEMLPEIAREITAKRVRRVAEGYTTSKGRIIAGLGGSFRYVQLGEALFDAAGKIRNTVRFRDLARHVFFTETGTPLPKDAPCDKPLLGVAHGTAVYLLYNGILKDKSVDGGNVLTQPILDLLPEHDGPKIIYAASNRVSPARLKARGITFKQTPYAIKVR